jgi:hypothetical protein
MGSIVFMSHKRDLLKQILLKFTIAVAFVFSVQSDVSADDSRVLDATPEQMVMRMTNLLKVDGDVKVLVDFISWNHAFDELSADEKAYMKVTNAQMYRELYLNTFEDPGKTFARIAEKFAAGVDIQNTPDYKTIETELNRQLEQLKKKLKNVDFKVTNSKVFADKAIISLSMNFEGNTHQIEMPLIKVNNIWFLRSPKSFEKPFSAWGVVDEKNG